MAASFFEPLAFDSQALGIPVARILPEPLHAVALSLILNTLRDQKIRLAYLTLPETDKKTHDIALQSGGIIVDHKLTYLMSLSEFSTEKKLFNPSNVTEYQGDYPSADLFALAFESGQYSRFRTDPYLTQLQFEAIYRQWMINSINHTVAEKVFVISETNKTTGMLTASQKKDRGDIGLLAVSEQARGKKQGMRLVAKAAEYFIDKNLCVMQVVTQKQNIPACIFYEKCGFHLEKTEIFYHFWL